MYSELVEGKYSNAFVKWLPVRSWGRLQSFFSQSADEVYVRQGSDVHKTDLHSFTKVDEFIKAKCSSVFAWLVYFESDEQAEKLSQQENLEHQNWQSCQNLFTDLENDSGWISKEMRFHVWVSDQQKEVVIAFRGTQAWRDWVANVRFLTWFIPFFKDHYDRVEEITPIMLERLRSKFPDYRIITSGHSLGGGLAQHAAYCTPEINGAYTYNSSPLTGYLSLSRDKRNAGKKDLFIARVFEHREALAYLRFILRKLIKGSDANPQISEMRFNFSSSGVVGDHEMGKLVEKLGQIVHQYGAEHEAMAEAAV